MAMSDDGIVTTPFYALPQVESVRHTSFMSLSAVNLELLMGHPMGRVLGRLFRRWQ
jgi:hypothetical protein